MKVCCVFSLESHHHGDSKEYTQYTLSIYKMKIILNLQPSDFFKGVKNEFETAMVNDPSVFDPLKVYYIVLKAR